MSIETEPKTAATILDRPGRREADAPGTPAGARPRTFSIAGGPGHQTLRSHVRGLEVLSNPLMNHGTAFTAADRLRLGLTGLLPPHVTHIEDQAARAYEQYGRQPDDLARNVYLTALHDRNEVLFHRLLLDHLREMLPVVYTPTVGTAIEQYSHQYRRPRGLFLSIDHPEEIPLAFENLQMGRDDVDLVVATDGEAILGIGDWGVGGIDISIGKLAVYTAAAGIHPMRVVPVVLDVGTDRQSLLDDPVYLGNRHRRVRGAAYDEFIDAYVEQATRRFPNAVLHWEDFGPSNARRILDRYRDRVCTFNDDIQGTGAVVLAAILAALARTGSSLADQRIVIFGAGTAGIGIAEQVRDAMVHDGLSPEAATERFWCLGSRGLIVDDQTRLVRDFQLPYARPAEEAARMWPNATGSRSLDEVVAAVHPTILIGTSAKPGAFTEPIVSAMLQATERPVILPLSNPTAYSEATPEQLLSWSDGRALVATGSPFDPVVIGEETFEVAQANNALSFPGIVLGTIVARASRMSDAMFRAGAMAIAAMSGQHPRDPILPSVEDLRLVSARVAEAVVSCAIGKGLNRVDVEDVPAAVRGAMWQPDYPPIEPA